VSLQATVPTSFDFRILGDLEVRAGGEPVDTLTEGQRRLLGTLLLQANTPVPREELARVLWPDDPIATALRRLTGQVTGLRRRFALPDGTHLVEKVPAGYLLSAGADELDAIRFRRLSHEGRQALASGDAEAAAELLQHALDLWRGPVLGGELGDPAAQEARRLEGLRATAAAALAEAERALASARPQAVRVDSEPVVAPAVDSRAQTAYEEGDTVSGNGSDGVADAPAELEAAPVEARRDRPRLALIGTALLGTAALAAAAVFLLLQDERRASARTAPLLATIAVDPNAVVQLDLTSGKVIASVDIGADTERVALADGFIWVLHSGVGTVSRVDPARGDVETIESVREARVLAASDAEGVWVAGDGRAGLLRLPTGDVGGARAVPMSVGVIAVALGGGHVWAVSPPATPGEPDTVTLVDAATANVAWRRPVGRDSQSVAYGQDAAWITSRSDRTVTKISARGDTETFAVGADPTGIAVTAGAVWIAHSSDGELWRLDPRTKEILARIPIGAGPHDVQAGLGSVWVTSVDSRTISRVDPETNRLVATFYLSYPPNGLAIGDDALWAAIQVCGSSDGDC
jgi:streptogramin lyase